MSRLGKFGQSDKFAIITPNPWLIKLENDKRAAEREKSIAKIKTPKGYIRCGLILNKKNQLCVWFYKKSDRNHLVVI